jgi:hypothetical protein
LFAVVQKLLQNGAFYLSTFRIRSRLFAWVGVKLVSDHFDLHFIRPLIERFHYRPSSAVVVPALPDRESFLDEISPRARRVFMQHRYISWSTVHTKRLPES